jgi:hypothetical protein
MIRFRLRGRWWRRKLTHAEMPWTRLEGCASVHQSQPIEMRCLACGCSSIPSLACNTSCGFALVHSTRPGSWFGPWSFFHLWVADLHRSIGTSINKQKSSDGDKKRRQYYSLESALCGDWEQATWSWSSGFQGYHQEAVEQNQISIKLD